MTTAALPPTKGPDLDPLPAGFDKGDESRDEYFVDYHIS